MKLNYEKYYQDLLNHRYLLGDVEDLEEFIRVAA